MPETLPAKPYEGFFPPYGLDGAANPASVMDG